MQEDIINRSMADIFNF